MAARLENHFEIIVEPCGSSYVIVELTKGQWCEVDLDDWFGLLIQHRWCATWNNTSKKYYACGWVNGKVTLMHRHILGLTNPVNCADHINRNPLCNRRQNIRACSSAQNRCNVSLKQCNRSGYVGVSWCKLRRKWRATARGEKYIQIGYFGDPKEAALARDKVAKRLYGEFAYLNFPLEVTA